MENANAKLRTAAKLLDKQGKGDVAVGQYDFDYWIKIYENDEEVAATHVTGHGVKLPDEKYKPVGELPIKLLLAVFMKRAGAIAGANQKLLLSVVAEVAEAEGNKTISDALYAEVEGLDRMVAEHLQPVVAKMAEKTRAGKWLMGNVVATTA